MGIVRFGLFTTFRIFLHGMSDEYFAEDSFCSWSSLTDPMKDQFLSSVMSMVAPTWCHGPT